MTGRSKATIAAEEKAEIITLNRELRRNEKAGEPAGDPREVARKQQKIAEWEAANGPLPTE